MILRIPAPKHSSFLTYSRRGPSFSIFFQAISGRPFLPGSIETTASKSEAAQQRGLSPAVVPNHDAIAGQALDSGQLRRAAYPIPCARPGAPTGRSSQVFQAQDQDRGGSRTSPPVFRYRAEGRSVSMLQS